MSYRQQRIRALDNAMTDVFLFGGKTDQQRFDALTKSCFLAGLNPENPDDRERMLGQIMACRRGRCEYEKPLIRKLAESYHPHPITRFFKAIGVLPR